VVTARRAAPFGVALLLCALTWACGGGSSNNSTSPSATQSAAASDTTPASLTATPAPDVEIPQRDLLDLAKRFEGYNGPITSRDTPWGYHIGDQAKFSLVDLDTAQPYEVTATVTAVTDHAYFFVENGSPYIQSWPSQVSDDFESVVWPTVTGAFGEPPTPGVDSDPRITVLNATLSGAGGYVSSVDEYPEGVVRYSNGREMIYLDVSALGAAGPTYDGLASHELQHLVHQQGDANEESWVNEGLSQVAWEMGGGSSDDIFSFLADPDSQLNNWPLGDTGTHYAESELFFDYLLDHYGGRDNAKALVDEQGNGITGVQAYLDGFGKQFDDVFADFVAANLLDEEGDGPYSHVNFDGTTTQIEEPTGPSGAEQVSQYGTHYIRLTGDQGQTFKFDGSDDVTVGIPNKDGAFWWSGRSDAIDSRLTREVDLTGVTTAKLTFDEWHDIEDGWDYGYVAVSEDAGTTWKALSGEQTTTKNPIGAAYGPGYTGESDRWQAESVDLDAYAGKKILLRFEVINDDATNLIGFAVDNIEIPAINFSDTADSTDGWTIEGFRQVPGPMAQTFIVQVIKSDGTVQRVDLGPGNVANIPLSGNEITISISGSTRNTTETARYNWTVQRTSA
jgi:immune inhibitor A